MINHLQTLLLNENAALVEKLPQEDYGWIDHSFRQIGLDKDIREVYALLFNDTENSLPSRLARVRAYLPLFELPELRALRKEFDQRVIYPPEEPASIFSFYRQKGDSSQVDSVKVLGSSAVFRAFSIIGNSSLDRSIELAKEIFQGTKETPLRMGALLFAVVFHLEVSRRRAGGK